MDEFLENEIRYIFIRPDCCWKSFRDCDLLFALNFRFIYLYYSDASLIYCIYGIQLQNVLTCTCMQH